jgi:hypothetical protein
LRTLVALRHSLLALLVLPGASLSHASGDHWTASAATTSILLHEEILDSLGLILIRDESTAATTIFPGSSYRSLPDRSLLRFRAPGGDFETFDSGSLYHEGGFVLEGEGLDEPVSLIGFELRVSREGAVFDLLDGSGRRWFTVHNMQFIIAPKEQRLYVLHAGLYLSPELRARLGFPDSSTIFVGELNIAFPAIVEPALRRQQASLSDDACVANFELPVDIELTGISALAQGAREPGGRVALAPSALLKNVGLGSIVWSEAIEPVSFTEVGPHPMLALAFYRLANGRLEQLGIADVKHAFRAINDGCPCPAGKIFYPACGDIYGVVTNLNRKYLAPREEVTSHTAAWTRLGSHFDQCLGTAPLPIEVCDPADEPDDYRDHQGDDPLYHDSFEHRLVVMDEDLATPDARYFIEAWYLVADDVDLWNSMGHREVTPRLVREAWSFSFVEQGLRLGSILSRLTEEGATSAVVDTGVGRLELAVETADLGGGMTHYDYALMNFDFDRQIERFEVAIESGVVVENISFSGTVGLGGSPWESKLGEASIVFEAPAGEALDWGRLYRFGFDANRPPVATVALATPLEAGESPRVELQTRGPVAVPEPAAAAQAVAAMALIMGIRRWRRLVGVGS